MPGPRIDNIGYRGHLVTIGEKISGTEMEEVLRRVPVGKFVAVYYDPAKPERALLERTLPRLH